MSSGRFGTALRRTGRSAGRRTGHLLLLGAGVETGDQSRDGGLLRGQYAHQDVQQVRVQGERTQHDVQRYDRPDPSGV
uniref:Putative secreted protein n=1 Tax=Anopheles triannulatus TaxID=58253 RepID=A0A2M4B7Q2_9DIPT